MGKNGKEKSEMVGACDQSDRSQESRGRVPRVQARHCPPLPYADGDDDRLQGEGGKCLFAAALTSYYDTIFHTRTNQSLLRRSKRRSTAPGERHRVHRLRQIGPRPHPRLAQLPNGSLPQTD